jgi:hypothetical protein
MSGFPTTVQDPGVYAPFEPSMDDPDLLLGWDPNAFLTMNETFQWDLAELYPKEKRR